MSNNRWTAGPKGSSSAARVGGKPAYAGQRQIAGLGGLGNRFLGSDGGRVGQETVVFPVEMRVVVQPRVEIAAAAVDGNLLDQPRVTERLQRVVDGGQRHRLSAGTGGGMKPFGGDMAVAPVAHQKLGQAQALARRPQARLHKPARPPLRFDCPCHGFRSLLVHRYSIEDRIGDFQRQHATRPKGSRLAL